ncbi:MAG: YceI family protein [Solirubrobacteraceae bacterium]
MANETSTTSAIPSGQWQVDAPRSSVAFAVKHMLLATVNGHFREFDGMLEVGTDTPRATGTIKAASIDTSEPIRDEHLKSSPDFFDIERYPEIRFNSTRIGYHDGGQLQIVGELTMRGITREIELTAQPATTTHEEGGVERVELKLRGELNRRDFDLTWNQALETGGALLGNKVKFALEISAVKSEATRPTSTDGAAHPQAEADVR